jgi:Mce-associated membrane protein
MPAGRPKGEKESAEVTEQASTEEPTETAAATTEAATGSEGTVDAVAAETPDSADADAVDIEEAESAAEDTESADESTEPAERSDAGKRKVNWPRVLAYGVLPGVALLLALAAGFARWEYVSSDYGAVPPVVSDQNPSPALEAMNAARDSTIKMLSYKPDTVDQQLNAARDLLTGDFRDSYTSLITDVVIPGAQQKQISAVASVPAMASVSADPKRAVVLVFVNQTVVVGQDLPSDTASSVRVTLDKVDGRWLISEFEPV